jgi:dUTP pyrophosphatase
VTDLLIQLLPAGEGLDLPQYQTEGSAGMDLRSSSGGLIQPGYGAAVHTGICVAIPEGYMGQIWPRSGLAAKHGIDVHGGLIDSDYRGEIIVLLHNAGSSAFTIKRGDRIAQLVIVPVVQPKLVVVRELPATERGEGGFGSTGGVGG